jgi:hypothetical protein
MEKKATSSGSNEFSSGKGLSLLGEMHLPQGAMNFLWKKTQVFGKRYVLISFAIRIISYSFSYRLVTYD